jgi:hypothetical protein
VVYIKAFIPKVVPNTTSNTNPMTHDENSPIDKGTANIQYIRKSCVQSGENDPRGKVLIVNITENINDNNIAKNLFIIIFLWHVVPY